MSLVSALNAFSVNRRRFANRRRALLLYGDLAKTQYLSRDEMHSLRIGKLRHVIDRAVNHVPFYSEYKRWVDSATFTFEDLSIFPIVEKNQIRLNPELFIADDAKSKHAYSYQTSGSTGDKFTFLLPYHSNSIENAIAFRAWSMGSKYVYHPNDPIVLLRSYAPPDGARISRRDRVNNHLYLSAFDINERNLAKYVELIRTSNAKLIRAYPSSIYLLTLLLKKHGIILREIETIVTSSETLLPLYRETVSSYWQMPVLDWYGLNERTVTVQQCFAGTYHNNDEYGILELDSDSQIISTSLNNDVMPFIRYATGDYATIAPDSRTACVCGRTLSVPFAGVAGRSDDLLVRMDGTRIPTINIYTAMQRFPLVSQFKIIQKEDLSLDVFLAMDSEPETSYLESIRSSLQQRVGGLDMVFHHVESIARSRRTGKVRAIQSLVRR